MSDIRSRPASSVVIIGAEPQLFVADLERALEFYARALGFTVAFTYGEPPFYAQVARGGAKLNLRAVDAPVLESARRDREQLLSATVTLDDAPALVREYEAAGVAFAQPLRTEPWGAQTFIVRDPDGNLILFAA